MTGQQWLGAARLRLGAARLRLGAARLRLGAARLRLGAAQLRLGATRLKLGAAWLRLRLPSPPPRNLRLYSVERKFKYLHTVTKLSTPDQVCVVLLPCVVLQ